MTNEHGDHGSRDHTGGFGNGSSSSGGTEQRSDPVTVSPPPQDVAGLVERLSQIGDSDRDEDQLIARSCRQAASTLTSQAAEIERLRSAREPSLAACDGRSEANPEDRDGTAEVAVYVVIRRDLKMRRGKEIAQGIHAMAQLGYVYGAPLVVLQARDLDHLNQMLDEACAQRVPCAYTVDAGRTEVEPGTITAAAFGSVRRGLLVTLSEASLY